MHQSWNLKRLAGLAVSVKTTSENPLTQACLGQRIDGLQAIRPPFEMLFVFDKTKHHALRPSQSTPMTFKHQRFFTKQRSPFSEGLIS